MNDDRRVASKEKLLRGAVFVRKPYAPWSPEWEHEHCELCGAEIAERERHWDTADAVNEAYSTPSDSRDDFYWVCPACFEKHRERLGWSLQPAPRDGNAP